MASNWKASNLHNQKPSLPFRIQPNLGSRNPPSMELETETSTPPIEVITSILLLLPIKDILRSKSVSKSWYNLISSPDFVKLHLNQHGSGSGSESAPERALILNSKNSMQIADFDSLNRIYKTDHPPGLENDAFLVGSCDGLICLRTSEKYKFGLLNPATRTSRVVSRLNLYTPVASYGYNSCFGFGYDSFSDDYKIVIVSIGIVALGIRVYSLRTDSWRVLWEEGSVDIIASRGAFVKGKMHWISQRPGVQASSRIRVFDIEHEYFRKSIMLPYCDERTRYQREVEELAEFGGNLCFVTPQVFDTGNGFCIHVWKEDSWTKLYTVPGWTPPLPVAACSRNGNRVLYCEGGKLYWLSIDELKEDRVQVSGAQAFSEAVVSIGSLVAV